MGTWSYTYDALGELLTQTDAKSQVTTLTYDLLGRVTQRSEADLTATWTYDTASHGVGLLASEATPSGSAGQTGYSRTYAYDTLSRPVTDTVSYP
jgi:YD repeat-containing protein